MDYYQAVFDHCAAQPDAVEDHPWGDTVFKIRGKIFAFLGHSPQTDVTVKADPDDAEGLVALTFIRRAAYVGRYGWVTVTVADEDALDLALELISGSYARVARGRGGRPAQPKR